MTAQPTPGTWEISPFERDGAFHIFSDERHWSIAAVFHTQGCTDPALDISREEADANARLIAAAPELLEALEMADRTLERLGCTEREMPRKRILTAIAKARGAA